MTFKILVLLLGAVSGVSPHTPNLAARDSVAVPVLNGERTGCMTLEEWMALQKVAAEAYLSEIIPGTSYFVAYRGIEQGKKIEVGDFLRLSLTQFKSKERSEKCDSLDTSGRVGGGEFPVGLEFVLLQFGVESEIDLSARKEPLSGLVGECAGLSNEDLLEFHIRIMPGEEDGVGDDDGRMGRAREAVTAYLQHASDQATVSLLEGVVAENPEYALYRCFYAGALAAVGRCEDYGKQTSELAVRGLVRDPDAFIAAGYCYLWRRDYENAADLAYRSLRGNTVHSETFVQLWKSAVEVGWDDVNYLQSQVSRLGEAAATNPDLLPLKDKIVKRLDDQTR
jgi:hypothetical protein